MQWVAPTIDLDFVSSLTGFGVAAMVAIILLLRRRAPPEEGRAVIWIAAGWLVLWNLEYLLGPISHVNFYDEGNGAFPIFVARAEFPDSGLFYEALSGGKDARLAQGEHLYWSLEEFLFKTLPGWLALLVHKLAVSGVTFWGTWLLCRRAAGTSALNAVLIAALATLGHRYVFVVTLAVGLGFALIPMICYVVAVRAGTATSFRAYIGAVIPVAILWGISVFPTHAYPAAIITIVATSFFVERLRITWMVAAVAILSLPVTLNAIDYLAFLWQYAPYTARVQESTLGGILENQNFWYTIREFTPDEAPIHIGLITVISLAILFLLHDARRWRALAASLVSLFCGPAFDMIPWVSLGLPTLEAIQYRYISYGAPTVVFLVLARAIVVVGSIEWNQGMRLPRPAQLGTVFVLLMTVYSLTQIKVANAAYWLGIGNQHAFSQVKNLKEPDWPLPDSPFRVVSVPYRLPPNFALTYGFQTFDGKNNLPIAEWIYFWRHGLRMKATFLYHSNALIGFDQGPDYWRCCDRFRVSDITRLSLLRVANVRYIFSTVPIDGKGLRQVSGPDPYRPVNRIQGGITDKLAAYWRANTSGEKAFVYEIDESLPRLYMARYVKPVKFGLKQPQLYDQIALEGPNRGAVIMSGDPVPAIVGGGEIRNSRRVENGYDISVLAAAGGLLILNVLPAPFWNATVDGKSVEIFRVNSIQMAVEVPPGTRNVSFRYNPPSIWQHSSN